MKEIQITITGKTPLLLNRFTDEAQLAATAGSRAAITNDDESPVTIAERALHTDDQGTPVITQPQLFNAIMAGGTFFRVGKSKVTTQKSSLVPAACQIAGAHFPIKSKGGWKVDTRPVRIPATGGRILRHRPCFDDWAIDFTLDLDETVISEKLMHEIVLAAGSRNGIGDYRPACKGPYGRFTLTRWEVSANGNGAGPSIESEPAIVEQEPKTRRRGAANTIAAKTKRG